MTMIDSETCHCGTKMGRSDHCPECYCEEYEADCGRRPQKRLVMVGKLGPWASSDGTVVGAGHIGPTGLNTQRS